MWFRIWRNNGDWRENLERAGCSTRSPSKSPQVKSKYFLWLIWLIFYSFNWLDWTCSYIYIYWYCIWRNQKLKNVFLIKIFIWTTFSPESIFVRYNIGIMLVVYASCVGVNQDITCITLFVRDRECGLCETAKMLRKHCGSFACKLRQRD